jgi:hypothetical protein
MNTSEQINELADALAKAQGQIRGAVKDAENPHFRSKYADLASVWDACRQALSNNGLSVIQAPRGVVSEVGWTVEVETRLLHSSGQWMGDTITVPVGKPDAQGVGSALTYARRYALASFVGVAPEDDDGNAAVGGNGKPRAVPADPPGYENWRQDMELIATEQGLKALEAAWRKSNEEFKHHTVTVYRTQWESLKKRAEKVSVAS